MPFRKQRLVSVLMTNHNYGIFIGDAVKSVAEQRYGPIEIIIVDDGSSDDSVERIRRLGTAYRGRFENFRIVLLEKNGGINRALNQGIPHVAGDMALILDADDMLYPDYVERTADVLTTAGSSDTLGFVYTNCTLINDKGEIIGSGKSHGFDSELLQEQSYIPGCGTTLTPALKTACPLDEERRVATKVFRWRSIVANGYRGRHIPDELFYYRMHDRNVSGIGERVIADLNDPGEPSTRRLGGYWHTK